MALKKTAKALRKHTHPRIQFQFAMFTIIAIIMIAIVLFDVITDGISPLWVLGGALLGSALGLGIGYVYKLHWHADDKRVIQSSDRLSLLLIALYVMIRVGGDEVLGQFVHGELLAAVLYSVIAGIMIGRVVALGRRVRHLLRSKRLI